MSSAVVTKTELAILGLSMDSNLNNTAGRGARQERKQLSFVHNSVIALEGPCSNELPVTKTAFERGPTKAVGHELDCPPSLHLATCHLAREVANGDLAFLGHVKVDGRLLDDCVLSTKVLGIRALYVGSGGIARTNFKARQKLRVGAFTPGGARHGQTG